MNNIIPKYVKNGFIIYTNQWKGYFDLNSLGYQHFTINHTIEFIIPNTKITPILLKKLGVGLKHLLRKNTEQKSQYNFTLCCACIREIFILIFLNYWLKSYNYRIIFIFFFLLAFKKKGKSKKINDPKKRL